MIVSMVLSHTKFVRGLEPIFLREGVEIYSILLLKKNPGLQGNSVEVCEGCSLHLNGKTSGMLGPVYSSVSSTGLVTAAPTRDA